MKKLINFKEMFAMENIAVIGKNKNLLVFNLVGVSNVIILNDDDDLNEIINNLKNNNFSIIFIEESLIFKIENLIIKYKNKLNFSIVSLPDTFNSNRIYTNSDIIYSTIKKLIGKNIYI